MEMLSYFPQTYAVSSTILVPTSVSISNISPGFGFEPNDLIGQEGLYFSNGTPATYQSGKTDFNLVRPVTLDDRQVPEFENVILKHGNSFWFIVTVAGITYFRNQSPKKEESVISNSEV